jgi:hypothetical protein
MRLDKLLLTFLFSLEIGNRLTIKHIVFSKIIN